MEELKPAWWYYFDQWEKAFALNEARRKFMKENSEDIIYFPSLRSMPERGIL